MAASYIFIPFLFLIFCSLVDGLQQTTLSDLRQFRGYSIIGRFKASEKHLVDEIRSRKDEDKACGNEVKLDLHELTPNMTDPSHAYGTGQLFVAVGVIEDTTLKEELSREMKDMIAVTHRYFLVGIPFTSGTKHGIAFHSIISDSPKHVLNPYVTNYQSVKRVDRIEETSDGTVFMYKDDDVMTLNIQYESECQKVENENLKDEFNQLTSNRHIATSYPLLFDWGCESLGLNVSFCEILEEYRCSLLQAGADVCTTKSRVYQRCPATLTLINMTGFFQNEVLPFVSDLPLVSFEAEWMNRTQSAGLLFPCFTD